MPPRSYKTTYIRKIPNTKKMDDKIQYLKSKPQPEQRTEEWYLRRYNMITASNAWKILDSQSNINSIIYEKCVPLDTSKNDSLNTSTAFHWGHKYEPLSVMYYEYTYKTKIEDYGCMKFLRFTWVPVRIHFGQMSLSLKITFNLLGIS